MVERLAWAVQTGIEQVIATFLECDAEALLPRRLRRYACARCWYEARRSGKPLTILQEWTLRACWRCWNHGLPLSDMAGMGRLGEDRRGQTVLASLVLRAERLRWKIPVRKAAIQQNKTILHYLVQPSRWRGFAPPYPLYQRRFAANVFHFSGDRIALLVLAHSSRFQGAHRFERLISTQLPERPAPGGGMHGPKKSGPIA